MSALNEQETSINYNREKKTVDVWTSDRTVMTKLDRLCETAPENYKCIDIAKTKDGELISNCVDISIYQQDYTFGDTITYMFNRIIDPNLITGVVINETVYPVHIVEDVTVRMEMLPKTKVFNWEEYQKKMPVKESVSE